MSSCFFSEKYFHSFNIILQHCAICRIIKIIKIGWSNTRFAVISGPTSGAWSDAAQIQTWVSLLSCHYCSLQLFFKYPLFCKWCVAHFSTNVKNINPATVMWCVSSWVPSPFSSLFNSGFPFSVSEVRVVMYLPPNCFCFAIGLVEVRSDYHLQDSGGAAGNVKVAIIANKC